MIKRLASHAIVPIAVVGPTASGKTEWGLALAKEHNGEIVSVDSRQVYRHLRVGTAKPAGGWEAGVYRVRGIPYHLVDIWEPDQPFTPADFIRHAGKAIEAIEKRGKRPILVGGTGMYLKALLEGLAPLPPADPAVRKELRAFADRHGRAELHAELARVDPEAARRIPANNIQRVLRALEVHRLTGKPISRWHQDHQADRTPDAPHWEILGVDRPREELHHRIADRCREMLEGGLIEETQAVLKRGVAAQAPGLTGLGYPRVIEFLEGKITKEALLNLLMRDTRQYAKRQMTWFRHQIKVTWTHPSLIAGFGGSIRRSFEGA
jgi:tRNA dimethylallyltransferase